MSLRILHLVNSLDPGGMENGVCNLAAGLVARGVETHVACLERSGAFAARISGGSNIHLLQKGGGFSLRAAWNLARLLGKLRPSVLHTHNLGPLIYAGLVTLGGRTRRILHGEHAQLAPWELEPRRIRQRTRLYRGCRAIHTVSRGQLVELGGLGFPVEKMTSIPNGVDTARFISGDRALAKQQNGIPQDALVIGLVGRFGPFKRHDALLEAFTEISAQFPQARLLFVGGGGSEESRIRELARDNARVHLTGFRADPEACYRAMDLLAVPSSNEGMSNAILEAMACGVPVLGNQGCGHEEVVSEGINGRIADLKTPADIAREITALLRGPLDRMGDEARRTVQGRFSLGAMLDEYEQIYRAVAR